ncbi:transglycosylase SLT domain-containing protein [Pasteurellaceae bacterium 22721_9_1]
MRLHRLKIALLGLLCSFSSYSLDLPAQRTTYQKIQEITVLSQSEATTKLAKQMLAQIEGYPLYPYAQYWVLNQDIANLSFEQILNYQQQNADLPFAERLKENWLRLQFNQQNWQAILQQANQIPNTKANQCLLLLAQWEQEKTTQKSTALLPQQQLEQLWLTGNNFAPACNQLFNIWQEQTGISAELMQQRAILAFEQNNRSALNDLLQYPLEQQSLKLTQMLIELLNSPQKLTDYISEQSTSETEKNLLEGRILHHIMPAYIKTLKAGDNWKFMEDIAQFEQWATEWKSSSEQLNQWKQDYLSHFFDVENSDFQHWRDQQLQLLKSDKLTERRIRMAIREKQPLQPWLALLSEKALQKEEWQYWTAQYEKKEIAQGKLKQLSQTRSFYGLLAASQLNVPYQPIMDDLENKAETPIASDSKEKIPEAKVEEVFAQPLARIHELKALNATDYANSEWFNVLKQVDFGQKLVLADYALKQNWYDLAVEATIQAKAWSYVRLRLPNAYPRWFDLHLNNLKINRTFAMAIARQESAWRANVKSHANARGLMQLLPQTAQQTATQAKLPYRNESQLFDPFYNIMLGTAHLQQLYDKYGDNRILIAAAYNAGPHRVDKWLAKSQGKLNMAEFIASIPFYETRNYVQNVLAYDAYYQILQQQPQLLFSKSEKDRLY